MVGVDHHHLGGAARGAARLDRARGAVADLEKTHQAGRAAAAGKLFAFAAQPGEIGAGAGAVFEQARLAHPQLHDAALVDEVVLDALDEAGVRLRLLVGRFGSCKFAGLPVYVIVALAAAIDAVGPLQARVDPFRRGRRGRHAARGPVPRAMPARPRACRGGLGSVMSAMWTPFLARVSGPECCVAVRFAWSGPVLLLTPPPPRPRGPSP